MSFKTLCISSLAILSTTSLAIVAAPDGAKAGTFSYSGNLTGQPTFNRPVEGTPPTPPLSSVGTAVPYQTQTFTVDTTSSGYEIIGRWRPSTGAPTGANPSADGYIFLYQNSFNPASPLTNVLSADDDYSNNSRNCSSAVGCSRLPSTNATLTLTAGVTYIVVASQFYNPPTDNVSQYTVDILTPGNAQVIFPSSASVPEPSSILGLLGLGLGFLASRSLKQG
jgi:hypothetical protein